MKLGIIGSGKIVQDFLPQLTKIPDLELAGMLATSRSLDKARVICQAYGIPCATDSFEELCHTGPDILYVAVPNRLHFTYCRKALEAGCHVIVEKPAASTYEELVQLGGLAWETGSFFFEAITTRYLGAYYKIQEWLPQIGQVKLVQCQFSQYSSRYDAFRAGEVLPAFDPAQAGGALMDLNLYNLHFVMGLFGEPEAARYYPNMDRGIDTSGIALLEYDGFVASCVGAKDSSGLMGGLIQGTDGSISYDASANLLGPVSLELHNGVRETYDDGQYRERMLPEFLAFLRAIGEQDRDFCRDQLEASLAVSRLMTRMRLEAGICFPGDN